MLERALFGFTVLFPCFFVLFARLYTNGGTYFFVTLHMAHSVITIKANITFFSAMHVEMRSALQSKKA